ncbi:MAG: hypothetical protein DRI71_09500 [Bacteroidetes bacterium]|nr:MAG: hypothetical protein DRI71_09500 [Bacteroidota bacterium]
MSGQNYTAAVLQRKLWARSNIGAVFINRQATNYNENDTTNSTTAFNRVIGTDFNFATLDDKWGAKVYFDGSFDPVTKKNALAHGAYLGYSSRHWTLNYFHNYVGEGYNAEVGFVPRTGTFSTGSFESNYIIYPETEAIVTIKPGFNAFFTFIPDGSLADTQTDINLLLSFNNTSELKAAVKQNFTYLFDDFDPTHSDEGVPLPAGSEYTWYSGELGFKSDGRKPFSYEIAGQYGNFYNGEKLSFISNLGYKFRPFGSFFVSAIYNDVQLPEPYASLSFWLIGPRLDVTFTNSLFLTTFVQYNEQADNVNINARFQWRFAPVSDLFIVYTDNYFPADFKVKNRAIVVKLSYWLNI